MKRWSLSAAVAAALLSAAMALPASAASVTTYSSRATFLGNLSSSETFSFTAANNTVVTTLGTAASVSTQGGNAQGLVLSNALCGSVGGVVDCFNPLVFTFTAPRNAFGYDNLDLNGLGDEEAVVDVSFANGDPGQSFVFNQGAAPNFTPVFFGLIADSDLASVRIYSRTPGTTSIGERANVVDEVVIGAAAVPEPSTYALMLAGLGLLGFMARRRRG